MPKEINQKLKLLYLYKILFENTDEEHLMSMSEILDRLEAYDIKAERKSIYSDVEFLRQFGIDVNSKKTSTYGYYIGHRDFELAELKLLVDSVQASRFITEKKSNALIKKIEGLTSVYHAKELQRQVYTADRVKAMNETIYYNVDTLHNAITEGQKVAFKYYEYNIQKQKQQRNNGEEYVISPYSLSWSDDNYYVIAHYPKYEKLTHFRVDRMSDIRILSEKAKDVKTVMEEQFNLGEYSRKIFNMYTGETQNIALECENSLINAVIDRFGEGVYLRKSDENKFIASVKINISPTFFAWVFTFGDKMKIISPKEVCQSFYESLSNVKKLYD